MFGWCVDVWLLGLTETSKDKIGREGKNPWLEDQSCLSRVPPGGLEAWCCRGKDVVDNAACASQS